MRLRKKARQPLLHLLLIPICLVWIYPFVWMLFSSLKTNVEYVGAGLRLLPESFQWENYSRAWTVARFSDYFQNSVVITVSSVLIVLVVSALAGYSLGRGELPGKRWILLGMAALMFIPKGYTIIPVFQIIKHLGLLNTIPGVILAESSGAHVIFILLFMAFYRDLPKELEEAAEIDGAGFIRTFGQVMLPLSKPVLTTAGIMQFIFTWNSFFVPLVFTLNKPELRTLAVGMYSFAGENSVDYTGMAAGAAIALVPVVCVFVLFQRYFVDGIAGSVKG
ncbi:carbohydrate ABC transporter permease [Cohnella thailandensis]|uniref:Carbohydrate ABC transporter permease n=1 Tax=Cohnella thailandensis TaxID=557557 RepID=A0A841SRD3_9BACL|nr:carbohydrate ABC transporter permease [Cohnella thailandensis]MBB6633166.1 carbohydrate ABC transporter permease [Cohnella thailandensis]MBP1975138.1 raffinose/stachyose/melibiose transport system permease protein [Cohnella thailandensis]